MLLRKSSFKSRQQQRGAIVVEAALLIPVFILVLWASAVLSESLLAQQRLHRATAAFADALANQPLLRGETLPMRINQMLQDDMRVLRRMLADPSGEDAGERPATDFGMRVTYLDSTLEPEQRMRVWTTIGMGCEASTDDFNATARLLTTPQNIARSELVRVEVCQINPAPALAVTRWVLPEVLMSHFVAQRRFWRG